MSPTRPRIPTLRFSFPRVSGDEPGTAFGLDAAATFSPRERG